MTTLIGRDKGVGEHFIMPQKLGMPIFNKNLHGDHWGKISNFGYRINIKLYFDGLSISNLLYENFMGLSDFG